MTTEIYLGKEVLAKNANGENRKTIVFADTSLFCDVKSVKYNEFYQAMQTGLKPEKVISLNKYEYYDYMQDCVKGFAKLLDPVTQTQIDYTILRLFELDNDSIELTLTRGIDNVSA